MYYLNRLHLQKGRPLRNGLLYLSYELLLEMLNQVFGQHLVKSLTIHQYRSVKHGVSITASCHEIVCSQFIRSFSIYFFTVDQHALNAVADGRESAVNNLHSGCLRESTILIRKL